MQYLSLKICSNLVQGTLTQPCATWAVPKPSFSIAAQEIAGSPATLASNQALQILVLYNKVNPAVDSECNVQ